MSGGSAGGGAKSSAAQAHARLQAMRGRGASRGDVYGIGDDKLREIVKRLRGRENISKVLAGLSAQGKGTGEGEDTLSAPLRRALLDDIKSPGSLKWHVHQCQNQFTQRAGEKPAGSKATVDVFGKYLLSLPVESPHRTSPQLFWDEHVVKWDSEDKMRAYMHKKTRK